MEGITTFWSQVVYAISNIRLLDVIDIFAIAYIVYIAIKYLRNSRSGQLVKGLFVLLVVSLLANALELVTLKWLLAAVFDSAIIVAVVLFQPELRRALESVGRSNLSRFGINQTIDGENVRIAESINEICKAVSNMQERKTGALIVFERKTMLGEIIDTGTSLDAQVSAELIQNIFFPKSPLHDGAVIIRQGRVASAGCILPLTANNELNSQLGTRHRAAIGMSENSDAVVVVVSEETGTISVAVHGHIQREFNPISLREELTSSLIEVKETKEPFYKKWFGTHRKNNGEQEGE